MKHIETAQHAAAQVPDKRFEASYREGWGLWVRMLNEEYLKAAFSQRADAEAFATKHSAGGHRGEIRKMWVLVNETLGEAYALAGAASKPLQAIDLDFGNRLRLNSLRSELLARLSDEELLALGLKRG